MNRIKRLLAVLLCIALFSVFALGSVSKNSKTTSSSNKSPADAAKDINDSINTTVTPKETTTIASETENETETEVEIEEINPDIPIGTCYELGQGEYECGTDIPAGRYLVEWVDGNQFGGYITSKSKCRYLGTAVSVDSNNNYTCIISAGDCFEISLSTLRFTKITSLPNQDYLQEDGSYLFGAGFFFEGIDIPQGKYNVTAVGGNQFGIYVRTKSKSFINLDQGETYNNLKLATTGAEIEISLGIARFDPVD